MCKTIEIHIYKGKLMKLVLVYILSEKKKYAIIMNIMICEEFEQSIYIHWFIQLCTIIQKYKYKSKNTNNCILHRIKNNKTFATSYFSM